MRYSVSALSTVFDVTSVTAVTMRTLHQVKVVGTVAKCDMHNKHEAQIERSRSDNLENSMLSRALRNESKGSNYERLSRRRDDWMNTAMKTGNIAELTLNSGMSV